MTSEGKYALMFRGLKDEESDTLKKVKTVFVADLELPIPQIQEILDNPPSAIIEGENKRKLQKTLKRLKAAGALVEIVEPGQDDDDDEFDDEDDEFAFELDLEELTGASKRPQSTRVWELDLQESAETEGLIADLEIPAMVSAHEEAGDKPEESENEDSSKTELEASPVPPSTEPETVTESPTAPEPKDPQPVAPVLEEPEDDLQLGAPLLEETTEEAAVASSPEAETASSAPVSTEQPFEDDLKIDLTEEIPEDVQAQEVQTPQGDFDSSSLFIDDAPANPEAELFAEPDHQSPLSVDANKQADEPLLTQPQATVAPEDDELNLDSMLTSLEDSEPSLTPPAPAQMVTPKAEEEEEVADEDSLGFMLEAFDDEPAEKPAIEATSASQPGTLLETESLDLNDSQVIPEQVPPTEDPNLSEDLGLGFDEETEPATPETSQSDFDSSNPAAVEDLGLNLDTEEEPVLTTPPAPESPPAALTEDLGLTFDSTIEETDAKESPQNFASSIEDLIERAPAEEELADAADEDLGIDLASTQEPPAEINKERAPVDDLVVDISANSEFEEEPKEAEPPVAEEVPPPKPRKPERKLEKPVEQIAEDDDDLSDLGLETEPEIHSETEAVKPKKKGKSKKKKKSSAAKDILVPLIAACVVLVGNYFLYLHFIGDPMDENPFGKFTDADIQKPKFDVSKIETKPKVIPAIQQINEEVKKQLVLKADEELSITANCDLSDKGMISCKISGSGPEARKLTKLELAKKVKRPPWIKKFESRDTIFKLITADRSRVAEGPIRVIINYDNRDYPTVGKLRLTTPKMHVEHQESPEDMLEEAEELKELNIDPLDIEVEENRLNIEISLGRDALKDEGFELYVDENRKFVFAAKYHFEY